MRVLVAPDSYKGTLTSVEVARAFAEGWLRARPGDEVRLAPLADGGEGTLAAVEAAGGWVRREAVVRDPLGRPIRAAWLTSSADGGRAAVVEMAQASGLSRLTAAERDPLGATTAGTGDLLRAALDAGVRDVIIGIGGSATTDGGAGMLQALGATVSDGLAVVDLAGLDRRVAGLHVRVACDVTNPLLGAFGAAAVYGPQKGASPADVATLDARLARFADALEAATGRRERESAGAGAAGGLGFGLLCLADRFASLALLPGIDLVMAAAGFDEALGNADLVLTGEGRIDAQTAFGKTALGVARRAWAAGVPCIAVGGGVTAAGVEALAAVGARVVQASDPPLSLEAAIAAGVAPLVGCGERLARELGAPKRGHVSVRDRGLRPMTEVSSDARLRAAILADRRRIAAGVRPLYHVIWATTPDGAPMVDVRIKELPIIHLFVPDLAGALDGARMLVARTLSVDPTSFDVLVEASPPSA